MWHYFQPTIVHEVGTNRWRSGFPALVLAHDCGDKCHSTLFDKEQGRVLVFQNQVFRRERPQKAVLHQACSFYSGYAPGTQKQSQPSCSNTKSSDKDTSVSQSNIRHTTFWLSTTRGKTKPAVVVQHQQIHTRTPTKHSPISVLVLILCLCTMQVETKPGLQCIFPCACVHNPLQVR